MAETATGMFQFHDRSPCKVIEQTPGKLIIVGKRIVDELALPINVMSELDGERCMIVVQGGNLRDGSVTTS